MHFDPMKQPYHSNRFCLTAGRGMVASSSALASQAGLSMLKEGGNAVDAIVAAAAVLAVVEPVSNSLGSDAFSLVWMDGKLHGLNASGYAPSRITAEKVLEKYPSGQMPLHGWAPVTVPGVPAAWAELNARFGRLPFKRVLEPAITYAQEGFPVPPMMGFLLERVTAGYHRVFGGAPEFAEWFRVFTKDGEPYRFGEMVRFPDHAKTLRLIAETDGDAYYKGEIAEQLGSSYCIIPSSIHELFIMTYLSFEDLLDFHNLVRHVNQHYVEEEEFLSDNLYVYHRESGKLYTVHFDDNEGCIICRA